MSERSASHLRQKGVWLVLFYLRSSIYVHTMTTDPLGRPGQVLTLCLFNPCQAANKQGIITDRVPLCLVKSTHVHLPRSALRNVTHRSRCKAVKEKAGVESKHSLCC